jgi:membrane-bound lytic murein transglycosylase B
VGHLADRILGELPFQREWPRGPGALKLKEKVEVQKLLNQIGYDVGEPDGIIGPNSRKSIRKYQIILGLTPDGLANKEFLIELRKARE